MSVLIKLAFTAFVAFANLQPDDGTDFLLNEGHGQRQVSLLRRLQEAETPTPSPIEEEEEEEEDDLEDLLYEAVEDAKVRVIGEEGVDNLQMAAETAEAIEDMVEDAVEDVATDVLMRDGGLFDRIEAIGLPTEEPTAQPTNPDGSVPTGPPTEERDGLFGFRDSDDEDDDGLFGFRDSEDEGNDDESDGLFGFRDSDDDEYYEYYDIETDVPAESPTGTPGSTEAAAPAESPTGTSESTEAAAPTEPPTERNGLFGGLDSDSDDDEDTPEPIDAPTATPGSTEAEAPTEAPEDSDDSDDSIETDEPIEDPTAEPSGGPRCVRLTTGSLTGDAGFLDVFVNGILVATGFHADGTVVYQNCHEMEPIVEVQNTNTNSWSGTAKASSDRGLTWFAAGCPSCSVHPESPAGMLVVDGDSDSTNQGEKGCLGGLRCRISLDTPMPTSSPTHAPTFASHLIRNKNGICIEAPQRNTRGSRVNMATCSFGDANQNWVYMESTGQIRVADGLCLDAPERNTPGSPVTVFTCDLENPNQRWLYDSVTGQIKNRFGICVDAAERNTEGGKVQMFNCQAGTENQEWELPMPSVFCGGFTEDTCDDVTGCSYDPDTKNCGDDDGCYRKDVAYPSNIESDIGASSPQECQLNCVENVECQFWTYNPTNNFCFLDNGDGGENSFVSDEDTVGLVSGPKEGCIGTPSPTKAPTGLPTKAPTFGITLIRNTDGICLDAPERNTPGSRVQTFTCLFNQQQRWIYMESTGLIQLAEGLCLDAPERNTEFSPVTVFTCDANNLNQQWSFDPATGQIKNKNGICIDASFRNTDGGRVIMFNCDTANKNQQWELSTELPQGVGLIRNKQGICIDTPNKNTSGSDIQMFTCDEGNQNQRWMYTESTGQIRISGGLCLDAPARNTPASRVQLFTCEENNPNQQWSYDASTGLIRNKQGICIDTPERNTPTGRLQMFTCDDHNPNQQWDL